MKKILAYSSMFFVVMMAVMSVSAAPSNYAGTWKLDPSKSTMPGPGGGGGGGGAADITLVVTQTDKTLTFERKVVRDGQAMPSTTTTYNLDGSESTNKLTGRMEGTAVSTAKWQGDGKILEINTNTTATMQGNEFKMTAVAHWELADGGKTLIVHTKSESPRGTQESKAVYTKQ